MEGKALFSFWKQYVQKKNEGTLVNFNAAPEMPRILLHVYHRTRAEHLTKTACYAELALHPALKGCIDYTICGYTNCSSAPDNSKCG